VAQAPAGRVARQDLPGGSGGPARRYEMIWLQGVDGIARVAGAPRRGGSTEGFRVPTAETQSAAGATPVCAAGLGAMLALQEAESGAVRDREARRHVEDLLAELARLQHALLGNGPDSATLERLAALARTLPEAADPRLGALLRAVALRAQVELARYRTITPG
jgi:hypothetical protein